VLWNRSIELTNRLRGMGAESLQKGERSPRGEFDASLKWEIKLTILAQALFGPPILALSSSGFTCDWSPLTWFHVSSGKVSSRRLVLFE
jgi:hypothetical protein